MRFLILFFATVCASAVLASDNKATSRQGDLFPPVLKYQNNVPLPPRRPDGFAKSGAYDYPDRGHVTWNHPR
jgi:hypothetical protein